MSVRPRREVDRPPIWAHTVTPARLLLPPVVLVAVVVSFLTDDVEPTWLGSVLVGVAAGAVLVAIDLWWRRTHDPSEDPEWHWLARKLYRRRR